VAGIFSIVGTVIDLIVLVLGAVGLPGLFALMAVESLGLPPLPGEIILAFSGVLMVEGTPYFNWFSVVAVALAGSTVGSYAGYWLARWGGPKLLHRWGARVGVSPREIDRAHQFFERRGEATVFLARLLPLIRAYISYPAGAARMDQGKFLAFTTLGALPFTVALVYLGVVIGDNLPLVSHYFGYLDVAVVVALIGLGVAFLVWRRRRAERRAAAGGPTTLDPPAEPG
jgi:membrane protein DedA with SNARE-associated domain